MDGRMRYALIKNGIVVNVIIADPTFILGIQSQYDACIDVTNTYCGPGFLYDGVSFTDPNPNP